MQGVHLQVFDDEGGLAGQHLLVFAGDPGDQLRVVEIFQTLADLLFARLTVQLLHRPVHDQDAALGVLDDEGGGDVFED